MGSLANNFHSSRIRNGLKHIITSPYQLSSNGLTKHGVQTFKNGFVNWKVIFRQEFQSFYLGIGLLLHIVSLKC